MSSLRHPSRSRRRRPRSIRLGVPFAAALLALSACGTVSDGEDADAGSEPDPSGTAGAETFEPVAFEHVFGTTEIDARPERVVALGWGSADAAIAMGVTPVGIDEQSYGATEDGLMPWVQTAIEEAGDELPQTLTVGDSPAFQEIAELEPDLILANYSGITEADYDRLTQIADTIAYPDQPWSTPWRDVIAQVGEVLGESERADEVLAGIDAEVSAAAEAHPEFEGTSIAAVAIDPSAFYVYAAIDPRVEFLEDLGFTVAPSVAELDPGEGGFFYTISTENVDRLTSDVLLSYAADESVVETIDADPTYQTMQQFQDGTVADVVGEDVVSSVSPPTALSLSYSLDTIVDSLAAAVPSS